MPKVSMVNTNIGQVTATSGLLPKQQDFIPELIRRAWVSIYNIASHVYTNYSTGGLSPTSYGVLGNLPREVRDRIYGFLVYPDYRASTESSHA